MWFVAWWQARALTPSDTQRLLIFWKGVTLGEARRTYLKGRKRRKSAILQLK
jgi:hypothetical protein